MAIRLNLAAPPSDDEILVLSERNPGLQFERSSAGALVVTPTGSEGGRRDLALGHQLYRWAETHGQGIAFGSAAGFRLPDGSLLSPDASWVRRERWENLSRAERAGFAPICPDAVFEIVSEWDSAIGLRQKMLAYVANGARLAVLIDPSRRAVEVYAPEVPSRVIELATTVVCDPALPGFILDVSPIFD
jgi:Uma2 family endonuclease